MLGSTHMIGGAVVSAAYLAAANPDIKSTPLMLAAVGVGAIGGLIPDIDHPSSKISQTLRPVNALVSLMFSHRGFFHTPILYLILWMLWLKFCPNPSYLIWGKILFLGIASHLILDLMNPGGIPVFFPFSSRRIHVTRIKTGGNGEKFVKSFMIVALWGFLFLLLLLH